MAHAHKECNDKVYHEFLGAMVECWRDGQCHECCETHTSNTFSRGTALMVTALAMIAALVVEKQGRFVVPQIQPSV